MARKIKTDGVTEGQYSSYEYGAMPDYTPKYQGKVDSTLGQLENYGTYRSQYQPQINRALSRVTDITPYTSRYQDQIDKYLGLMNQEYDPNSDASYLAYKNQYLRGGQKAMQDTLAQAVALSGGFDNSYANSVAQQTYGDYAAALADKIPELAQAAQNMYMNKLGVYRDLDATDYGRWSDDRANNYNVLNALMGVDNTAYGRWQDTRANLYDLLGAYQNEENRNYNMFQDEYSRWNTAYNQQKALEDAAARAASGGGGGRSGGGGESIYTTVNRMVNNGASMPEISRTIQYSNLSGMAAQDLAKAAQQAVIDRNGTRSQINSDLSSRKRSGRQVM